MIRRKLLAPALFVAAGVAALVGSIAIADPSTDTKAPGKLDFQLPPGWTEADMQACILAGTPGKQHERLANDAGVWHGKTTMWMAPDAEPMEGECVSTVTSIMDGRYIKTEMEGETPGMGPFHGVGVYGYDNVMQKFVASWIDNHSTGIMQGEGELSEDGKTIEWTYTHSCPLTKKKATIRDVETVTGPTTKTLESYATDPKSGKEFKMMRIEFTRS